MIPSAKKSGNKSAARVAVASAASADAGVGSLLDEVGFQRSGGAGRCPNCKEDLTEEAVLCVACGYNLETGKMIRSKVKRVDDDEDEDDGVAPDHVASAEPGKKGGSKAILLLVLLLVLGGAVAFRMGLIPGL